MTYTPSIPDHNGCTIAPHENQWPAFDSNNEYCGNINRIAAWQVPEAAYKPLNLPNHLDLYLTSEGHWAPTLEIAEHLLASTPSPQSFTVKGSTISLFVPPQWAEENGNPNRDEDYRVFRTAAGGCWDAESFYVSRRSSSVGLAEVF